MSTEQTPPGQESLVRDADEQAGRAVDDRSDMGWSERKWARLIVAGKGRPVALLVMLAAAVILVISGDTLQGWRNIASDINHRLAPRAAENLPVRIVEIDEASLRRYGQWPWPRHVIAELVQGVVLRGAIVVGLDLIFPEPDRLSPQALVEFRKELPEDLRTALQGLPSNDETFANVIGRLPIVLGRAAVNGAAAEPWKGADPLYPPTELQDPSLLDALPKADAVVANLPELEARAIGLGTLNGPPDDDGVVRRVPLAVNVAGQAHGSMTLEVLRVALGSPTSVVTGADGTVQGIDIGGNFFATDPDGRIQPYFTPSLENRFVSAGDILAGIIDPDAFENRIVLVGVTGIGVIDKRSTPVSPLVHGVEIQAQVLENLLLGSRLQRPDWAVLAEICILLILGGAVIYMMPVRPVWMTTGLFLAGILAAGGASHTAFVTQNVLLDPLLPGVFASAVYLTMLGALLTEMDRRRRSLRAALQKERLSAARIAGELQAARDIQMGILPDVTALHGLPETIDIQAFLESAKEVGGDLYDAFMVDGDRLFFLVGDVTGKGIPASLFMALSKAMSKSAALRGPEQSMDEIMELANDEISRENPAELFVTVFAGVIDGRTGRVEFCNAGHEDPHILGADGSVRVLKSDGGPPLCVFEGFPYPMEEVTLAPGETLVITTDGVTEARNKAGDLFGHERLVTGLARLGREADLKAGLNSVVRDVRQFEDGTDPTDDLTLMAIRFTGA